MVNIVKIIDLFISLLREKERNRHLILDRVVEPLQQLAEASHAKYLERLQYYRSLVIKECISRDELITSLQMDMEFMYADMSKSSSLENQLGKVYKLRIDKIEPELDEYLEAISSYYQHIHGGVFYEILYISNKTSLSGLNLKVLSGIDPDKELERWIASSAASVIEQQCTLYDNICKAYGRLRVVLLT